MVVDIPNHSFSFSLSPFFLSLFSLFSLFSRVQLSGRAPKGDPSKETGTKQRKAYTKYQDEEGNRDTSKKDI